MGKLTQNQFGAAVGISTPSVSGLSQRGIIDLTRGLEQSILDYCAHLREKAAGRSGNGDYDLTEERARLAHHQANIAALDEQVKAKQLIPADLVLSRWQDIAATVRAKLLSMPSQLAATCAHSTREDVERKAMSMVRQALEELATDVEY